MKRRNFIIGSVFAPVAAALGSKILEAKPEIPPGISITYPITYGDDSKPCESMNLSLVEAKQKADALVRSLYPNIYFSGFRPKIPWYADYETAEEFIGQFLWQSVVTYQDGFKETVFWYVSITLYGPSSNVGLNYLQIRDLNSVQQKAEIGYKKVIQMQKRLEDEKIMRNWRRGKDWPIKKVKWYHYKNNKTPRYYFDGWKARKYEKIICA